VSFFFQANSRHVRAQVVGQSLMTGYNGFPMMSSAKTIATLASVAVIGCSLFAFSWIGLALLGF
jgi:hypothetical protein